MTSKPMRILGIDPGLATVGIGVVEKSEGLRFIDCCTIETQKGLPLPMRLKELMADLSKLIAEFQPDLAVVEKLYFATNRKTAMDVSEARGVILLTLMQHGLEILEPTPLELKAAVTGDGKADKKQMRDMLLRMLKLEEGFFRGAKDDATDAVALALYGAVHCGTGLRPVRVRAKTI